MFRSFVFYYGRGLVIFCRTGFGVFYYGRSLFVFDLGFLAMVFSLLIMLMIKFFFSVKLV